MTYKEMLEKLRELEERISALEFVKRSRPIVPQPMTYTLGCSVCGLGSDGPMAYACPRPDCPSAIRCNSITGEY